jgi:hypothetical protein
VPIFTTFKAIFRRWGSARVAHGPIFVFRTSQLFYSSCFIAFVLGIPNGFWPLDRAVGRAYIREIVPSVGVGAIYICYMLYVIYCIGVLVFGPLIRHARSELRAAKPRAEHPVRTSLPAVCSHQGVWVWGVLCFVKFCVLCLGAPECRVLVIGLVWLGPPGPPE